LRQTVFLSLQSPTTGSFAGDTWGETDTRFTYIAVSSLSLLGTLSKLDRELTIRYLRSCRNLDGGFGSSAGAESHGAQGAPLYLSLSRDLAASQGEKADRDLTR
jgi:prenyltransferase beta subunit